MELGSRDDLGELLHVCRLDVDNIEALVLDVQVPQINSQVIAADKRLSVAVYRDAVDVIGVSIGVGSARHGSDDGVVMCEARQLQVAGISELVGREGSRSAATAREAAGSEVMREVVLRHDLQRLLEDFPKLDSLVVGG